MKVFIDTNVLLDVSLERKDFYTDSAKVLSLAAFKEIEGCITATTTTDLFYIIRKHYNIQKAKTDLKNYLTFLNILPVNENVIRLALTSDFKDFEDAVQYFSCSIFDCTCIVTRNVGDFKEAKLPVYTPKEFLLK